MFSPQCGHTKDPKNLYSWFKVSMATFMCLKINVDVGSIMASVTSKRKPRLKLWNLKRLNSQLEQKKATR